MYLGAHFLKFPIVFKSAEKNKRNIKEKLEFLQKNRCSATSIVDFGITLKQMIVDT